MIAKPFLNLTTFGLAGVLAASLAVAAGAEPASPSATAPDPARGERLFLQCAACHSVAPSAANTVGPNLSGVVGAAAATRPGYKYSPALAASGLVWTATNLDAFLTHPNQKVPGTKMAFAGVADPRSRADLIAYLTTLKIKK